MPLVSREDLGYVLGMRGWIVASALIVGCSSDAAPPPEAPVQPTMTVALPTMSETPPVVAPAVAEVQPVELHLFIMSQCPYSVQMLPVVAEAIQGFGDKVKLRVDFVGKETDGKLSSMHGEDELQGDLAEICAMRHTSRWLEMLQCQMEDYKSSHENWRVCAKRLEVQPRIIERCMGSEEGKELLSRSFAMAKEKGVTGTPTLLIEGVKYTGRRSKLSFIRKICAAAVSGAVPQPCEKLATTPPVNVILLNDARCAECNTIAIESALERQIDNPLITIVDYDTEQGKDLYALIKPRSLPALIFDASIATNPDAGDDLKKTLEAVGDKRVSVRGPWNPTCLDDKGCEQKACKSVPVCRTEKTARLELYMMSKCPFAAKGVGAAKETLDALRKAGSKIDLAIYYIGSGKPEELRSAKGQTEVDEDLRQVCVQKRYPKDAKFLDYIVCRAEDLKSDDWQSCATKLGMDVKAIEKCATGSEGKRLLLASFEMSAASGIKASPTWLANGKYKFSGIAAAPIRTNLCEHNKGMKGCP